MTESVASQVFPFLVGLLCGGLIIHGSRAFFTFARKRSLAGHGILMEETPEAIFASMSEGVIAVNNQREIWFLNPAARQMLGLKSNPTGQNLERSELPSLLIGAMDAALSSETPVECEYDAGGAKPIALQLKASQISDVRHQACGAVVVFSDITRLRRLERVRKDFVANVSHELRTPITAIRGFVETLLSGTAESAEERSHFLEIIHRHAERLQSIVDDLLILSKIEQGGELDALETEELNLAVLAQSVIRMLQPQARRRGVAITLIATGRVTSTVNRRLIEQALMNLLDNALKYSPENSFVRVEVEGGGDEITLSVRDSGPGIAKEHQTRIFERFYRVDKGRDRKVGGTGLGLAIVKHVAMLHGGKVWVESDARSGSRFVLTVPRAESTQSMQSASAG